MAFRAKHCAWFCFGIMLVCVLYYCISDARMMMVWGSIIYMYKYPG